MYCERFQEQLTDYVIDALEPAERVALEDHLATCGPCRSEVDSIAWTWKELGVPPVEKPDSEAMRARFEGMIEAYRRGAAQTPVGSFWHRIDVWVAGWWPASPVLQLGLALVLFAGGAGIATYAGREAPAPDELAELRTELQETQRWVALSLMQQQSASERLRGVSWSNRIDGSDNDVLSALLETLRQDPNVNVRLAAVDALKRFGESETMRQGTLAALTSESSPLVQSALIDLMVELQEPEATGILERLAADNTLNEGVRTQAAWGLEQFR